MISSDDSTVLSKLQSTGRVSGDVYTVLKRQILDGATVAGSYLPTERQLSGKFNVAHTTIRRALAKLQTDGLIRAESRKGYRVLSTANDPLRGCPLAYVRTATGAPSAWDEFHARLMSELQNAADRNGWPLVAMGDSVLQSAQVRMRLATSRAWGAILDANDPAALASLREAGLPVVMIDSWVEGSAVDSVLQDDHHGGMLAIRALVEAGCRRIAWFGPIERHVHVMDRFGGFCAGLLEHGLHLSSDSICITSTDEALASARKLLSGSKRPDGIVAFWGRYAKALVQAATEFRLTLGKDLHLIGWTPNEMYPGSYANHFQGIPTPPAVTWELRAMADAAAALLLQRRTNPALPPLRVRVPVRLRMGP